MKKLILIACLLVGMLSLFGCSNDEDASQKLTVNSGFTQTGAKLNVGVEVCNPDEKLVFPDTVVVIAPMDEKGNLIGTEQRVSLGAFYASETFGFGIVLNMEDGQTVDHVQVSITSEKAVDASVTSMVSIDEGSIKETLENGYTVASGIFTNNSEVTYRSVMVGSLVKTADGEILGGSVTSYGNVLPGENEFTLKTLALHENAITTYYAHIDRETNE